LVCFTLALFLFAIAIPMLLRSLAFQSTGVTAKGIILSHDSSTDSDDKVSYYLVFSYKDKAEHKYTGRDEVSESLSESTADGTSCLITYLKDDPAVSKFSTTDSKYVESLVFLVVGGASILIGVFPLGFGARMGFQRLHLLAKGQLQPAIVTSVDVTESKDDDGNLVKSYNLHYEYVAGANIVPGVTKLNTAKATEWTENLAKGIRLTLHSTLSLLIIEIDAK
jgi:hypothetical protein